MIPLQQLKAVDLKRYHDEHAQGDDALASATLEQHHTIAHSALQAAVLEGLVQRNVAKLVVGKPHASRDRQDVLEHCWEAHDLPDDREGAPARGPACRLLGARALTSWRRIVIRPPARSRSVHLSPHSSPSRAPLSKPGSEPVFGPVKNKTPRTIELSAETIPLLRRHRGHQAELKLRNGERYHEHGLVFAKQWEDLQRSRDTLGDPLQANNLGQREFRKLLKAAEVRRSSSTASGIIRLSQLFGTRVLTSQNSSAATTCRPQTAWGNGRPRLSMSADELPGGADR